MEQLKRYVTLQCSTLLCSTQCSIRAVGVSCSSRTPSHARCYFMYLQNAYWKLILSYLLWSNTINTHQHYLSADVQRREVMIAESLFCKIMNRFFSSSSHMAKGRIQELGFLPSPPSTSTQYPTLSVPLCARFEAQIMTVLPSLMPSKDFDAKREAIRASLQVTVRGTGVVPPGTQVALFGSSMNNFGKDDAGDSTSTLHHTCGCYINDAHLISL